MLWPDVTRRIWSYIIAKLGIFTNVDPSQLELSATKLRLNQLEVDHSKLDIPGMTTQKFVIGQLGLELGVSGLFISANTVSIELMLDKIESADLGISMLMEATKNEINSEIPTENEVAGGVVAASDGAIVGPAGSASGSSAVGGMASKIADLALSQISATVKEINIDVHLSPTSSIGIHIEQGILSSKHKLELESISINYSEADQMMKSVYFDTSSTLMSVPELAFINRIVVDFTLDSMIFSVLVDHARVAGVSLLKWMVTLMNEHSGQTNDKDATDDTKKDSESEASGDLTVGTLEIYETLEGSRQPLKLHNIKLSQEEFVIEELELPEVVHVSPFFSLNKQKTESGEVILQASVDVPVSVNIPLDFLSPIHQLIDTITAILAELELEDDREATKFIMKLPELRIGIDNGLAVLLVFPQDLSQEHLSIRECILTAADGQILLKNLDFDFGSKVDIDEVRMKITQRFLESIDCMKNEYDKFIPDSELDKSFVDNTIWNGIELPELSLRVQSLLLDYESYRLNLYIHCLMSAEKTTLKAEARGLDEKSELELDFQAISRDSLRSIDSALLLKKCNIHIPLEAFVDTSESSNNAESKEIIGKESNNAVLCPTVTCSIKFDTDVNIFANEVQSRLTFENSYLSFDPNQTLLVIPRAVWGVLDTTFVNLLKVKNLKYKLNYDREHSLSISRCVLSTCADTHHYIVDTISKLIPEVPTPSFKTELDGEINVLEDVEQEYFVPNNMEKLNKEQEPIINDTQSTINDKAVAALDIHDNYMGAKLKSKQEKTAQVGDNLAGQEIPSTTLRFAANHLFELKMKQFQWQIFDGYDFESSRIQAAEIANAPRPSKSKHKQASESRSSSQNANYNEEDDMETDDEDYDEDDDMPTYQNKLEDSMFITPQAKPSKRSAKLSKKRQKEPLLPDNFVRSTEAFILLTIRKLKFASADNKTVTLVIRDGHVNDQVPASKITDLLMPLHPELAKSVGGKELVSFTQSLTGSNSSPEKRIKLSISPLKLSVDQDTAEFIGAFFSFGQVKDFQEKSESGKVNTSIFIQSLEFSGLQLLIDYIPKKLDYKSLRSGTTAELLNVFTVKGAKLNLKSAAIFGLTGWDQVFDQLLDLWTPDIKATQLAGLVAGIAPIRKALMVSKEVRKFAVRPVTHTVVAQGAGALMRRAFGELLKMGQSWLESSDQVLGGPQ